MTNSERINQIKKELGKNLFVQCSYDGTHDAEILTNGEKFIAITDSHWNGECYRGYVCDEWGSCTDERINVAEVLLQIGEDEWESVGYLADARSTVVYA